MILLVWFSPCTAAISDRLPGFSMWRRQLVNFQWANCQPLISVRAALEIDGDFIDLKEKHTFDRSTTRKIKGSNESCKVPTKEEKKSAVNNNKKNTTTFLHLLFFQVIDTRVEV